MVFTDGEIVHFNKKTWTATAVNHEDNRLFSFLTWDWYSGWPSRPPKKGDKIRIRWSDGKKFLCARLSS